MPLLLITKTRLTSNFLDCEYGLINYNAFRFDRCIETSDCLRFGGVLIDIRKDVPARLSITPMANDE